MAPEVILLEWTQLLLLNLNQSEELELDKKDKIAEIKEQDRTKTGIPIILSTCPT